MFHALMDRLHQEFDLTLVIVSHDLRAVLANCQRVACLNQMLHFHDVPEHLGQDGSLPRFPLRIAGLGPDPAPAVAAQAMGRSEAEQ